MQKKEMVPTSVEQLKEYKNGQLVELPPFAEGQEFCARLRRPSMMVLIRSGKIPNSLLGKAEQLFNGGAAAYEGGENPISEVLDILDIICDAMFLQPTFKEIKATGITLTDDQYTFLFNYAQTGVKALEPFFNE